MPVKGLTQAEIDAATAAVVAAGGKSTDRANRLPGETATEANARITAAYKDQPVPELTKEGKAAGATMEFVRTGAGGVGTYKEIYPIGTPIPTSRTTEYGNTYDQSGNLISGSGLKTGVPGTTPVTAATTPATVTPATTPSTVSAPTPISTPVTATPSSTGSFVASDGKTFTNSDAFTVYQAGLDDKKESRVSAYNLLYDEFDKYGLGTLVSDIRNILVEGSLDPAEFSLKVRGTDAYKARFAANEARMAKGLRALSPAAYIALEDQYQEVMRQYGLPESYYAKTGTGVQEGFRKLIENDVSNIELEDRISTAQKRVLNANPEVTTALKQFYPDITNADILAYTLDPKNAIENIKRKVTAAEIGGAAIQSGLQTGVSRAEQLGAAGVTKDTAEKGFGTIAGGLQRGSQLASIYGEDPYTQTTAEKEVFGLAGKTEAEKQRKKLTGLEKATFGGQTGLTSGALARDRAGAY
jgi:hypothetical protein